MKHHNPLLFCILFIISLTFGMPNSLHAQSHYCIPGTTDHKANKSTAEGCLPSSAYAYLDINNVRARIMPAGDMWWDLTGSSEYFVPHNSYISAFFAFGLWLGAMDENGNLKVAAQRYRGEGVDFWPGPLTIDGTDTTDPATCNAYDRLWVLYRSEVEQFRLAYQQDPTLTGYTVPQSIIDYPAHGDPSKNQSFYLAPFYDADHNGIYDYTKGDYPYYDFDRALCPGNFAWYTPEPLTMEGNGLLADQILKGDQTIWWVFNDKGNIHMESKGAAMGLEIRAQAYAFATNDEINDMTFYSYEIINRSTVRLNQFWFGFMADTDLGDSWDDFVGCDVRRGLGYCYNGKDPDGYGLSTNYGAQPPAAGIDIIQGPYMDKDGMDNPRFDSDGNLICDVGINGVNFGDGKIDNERLGMRKFLFYNCGGGFEAMSCPDIAPEYYQFLRGIWKDGETVHYWGNAHPNAGGTGPECSFMFPGDSDPCNWGTNGIDPGAPYPGTTWTEPQAGNQPYDRRFMMSSGPFSLEPGAVNYVTLGVPWARACGGGPLASLEALKIADDKAQALFDHCFEIVEGPDAPDLTIQELDRELILYLSNRAGVSNNYRNRPEDYAQTDYSIVFNDTVPAADRGDSAYRFEGYQIFQTRDAGVTFEDLHNPDKARLVAQCDISNGISRLINYYYDEALGSSVPVEEVDGADAGIVHSFRVFEDMFAAGDKRLVNHRQYYYMAIAYAHNNYRDYNPGDPFSYFGQKHPYLAGKKGITGVIRIETGIPHKPSPESGGTITHAEYGVQPMITRVEGQGNGGLVLDLTPATVEKILASGSCGEVEYKYNKGPVNIKVIDPLKVAGGNYSLKFLPPASHNINHCTWQLTNLENGAT